MEQSVIVTPFVSLTSLLKEQQLCGTKNKGNWHNPTEIHTQLTDIHEDGCKIPTEIPAEIPAERKYVNKDGSLSATSQDAVYFKTGAYENTFVVYFDNAHFVNVDQYRALLVNDWGPGGRIGVADGGNSCQITAVGKYDITDVDFLRGEGLHRVQKVIENGEIFILLPDGSKYTVTGVKVE